MIKKFFAVTTTVFALMLAGCASESSETVSYTEPTTIKPVNDYTFISNESTVFIYRDGRVISLDIESFTEDYYDIEEFKSEFVNPAIEKYLAKAGADSIKLDSVQKDGNNLELQISYKTTNDYLTFNKDNNKYFADWKNLSVCDYAKISESGYALPAELLDTTGAVVGASSVKSDTDLHVCIIDFGTAYPTGFSGSFMFEGDVAYVSSGITITSGNAVKVADAAGQQYIIFK